MDAFLGAIGLVGVIIGIILMILGKIKKKKYRGGIITIVALILFIVGATIGINKDGDKTTVKTIKETKTDNITWKEKVKKVALTKGSTTEKYDEIMTFAKSYQPTKTEITTFTNNIVKEYKDKKYIMDLSNHEYMLGNMFKAEMIEKYYDDSKQKPIDKFAYDFLQNSKYNYRGVENMTSDATLANEKQMDKTLAEMGK